MEETLGAFTLFKYSSIYFQNNKTLIIILLTMDYCPYPYPYQVNITEVIIDQFVVIIRHTLAIYGKDTISEKTATLMVRRYLQDENTQKILQILIKHGKLATVLQLIFSFWDFYKAEIQHHYRFLDHLQIASGFGSLLVFLPFPQCRIIGGGFMLLSSSISTYKLMGSIPDLLKQDQRRWADLFWVAGETISCVAGLAGGAGSIASGLKMMKTARIAQISQMKGFSRVMIESGSDLGIGKEHLIKCCQKLQAVVTHSEMIQDVGMERELIQASMVFMTLVSLQATKQEQAAQYVAQNFAV